MVKLECGTKVDKERVNGIKGKQKVIIREIVIVIFFITN